MLRNTINLIDEIYQSILPRKYSHRTMYLSLVEVFFFFFSSLFFCNQQQKLTGQTDFGQLLALLPDKKKSALAVHMALKNI